MSAKNTVTEAVKEFPRWVHIFTKCEDPRGERLRVVVDDVIAIVRGKKYPDRGATDELRFPEDISASIARDWGYSAY